MRSTAGSSRALITVLDLLVHGGVVIDGGGGSPQRADVGVTAGQVAAVGDLATATAREELDARGRMVAPGFVDVHTHADLLGIETWRDPDLELALLRQGVTTQIAGNCGFSVFPHPLGDEAASARLLEHVRSLLGDDARVWPSVTAYERALEDAGPVMNVATMVGHGSVRAAVNGSRSAIPRQQTEHMTSLVDRSLAEGAVGLSTGLVYSPGSHAPTDELVGLTEALHRWRRPYVTHLRNEADGVVGALEEAIEIADHGQVPLHVSHHKVAGGANRGRSRETLDLITSARERGLEVTLDAYPYTASSTSLHSLLPPWLQKDGFDALLRRLEQPETRERLRHDIAAGRAGWENMIGAAGWNGVQIARAPGQGWAEGRTLAELSEDGARDGVDALVELQTAARRPVTVVLHVLADEDVERILADPWTMIGSDGIPLGGKPHPRLAGSFARVLGRYVRERALYQLSEAVWRMSGLAADCFGLAGRGRIREGAAADLVVFGDDEVEDTATFAAPLAPPRGIDAVVVNGAIAVRRGEFTGRRAGRFLRPEPVTTRPGYAATLSGGGS